MLIREKLYELERQNLSPYAMLCENTKGRMQPIEQCEYRTEYMRDRDRIIHSKAFRRLKDKTQVFINPTESHYRTRLTHTMEVSQIARTISKALMLNEDLTEAIALGHDLGHTPFGHAGERALRKYIPGFEHNLQSLRMVDKIENGKGLNLTYEVRDGIKNHKKRMTPCTLEGMAVNVSDRIAYLNHDIDDALRAGVLKMEQLPRECIRVLGETHSQRINTMITDIVKNSQDKDRISMTEEVNHATEMLRDYMFHSVYKACLAAQEEQKVHTIIGLLFERFCAHPEDLPQPFQKFIEEDGIETCVADYIAGMTDEYAVLQFEAFFVPKSWTML